MTGKGAEKSAKKRRRRAPREAPLAVWKRVLLLLVGWLLILIGIAGLVLPGIQGVLTIFVGAAVLSLVSELAYEWLRRAFRRWPKGWKRVYRLRRKVHRWLHPDEPEARAHEDS